VGLRLARRLEWYTPVTTGDVPVSPLPVLDPPPLTATPWAAIARKELMRQWMTLALAATLSTGVAVFAAAADKKSPPGGTSAAKADGKAELKVGDAAPDFDLPASDGKTYKLSDFKGKQAVVVAWFPKAFTGGCTAECKSLAENADKIRKYDVAFFMASVDAVAGDKGNKAFAEAHKATFPILGDEKKVAAAAYGVLSPRGFSNRWTYYIDKDGKVAAIDKAVKPASSAEDMIAKLKELNVPQK
jgi:peroxiredoxin Q/BCP